MTEQRQLAGTRQMKRVRAGIERWRSSREKLGPMPARLWREAASLAREVGVGPVGRALGLNHQALKRHVEAEGAGSEGVEIPTGRFIELGRTEVVGLGAASGPVVEFSDTNGVRLTVRLPVGSGLNLAELVEVFCGRPA